MSEKLNKQLAEKYPDIVRWGMELGSFTYYINMQLSQAEQDNAPVNATFKQHDGAWATN